MVHEIVHLDLKLHVRDFYVPRSHMDITRFEPFNLTLNLRNHCYSTICTKVMIARNWLARKVYYPYDFEAHKNLFHKQFPISVYVFMDGAVC